MTLALYGKSRRRQGGLVLAGFVALMIAVIGGVATISSAFAHHAELRTERTCNTATVHFDYVGPGTRTYIIETRPQNSGGWTPVASFQVSGSNVPDVYPAVTVNLPSTVQYRATLSGNEGGIKTVDFANFALQDCGAKIIVRKYVPDNIAGTPTIFTADIRDNGTLVADDVEFSEDPGTPGAYQQSFDVTGNDGTGSSDNDDFTVKENALAGFSIAGYWIQDGDKSCASGGGVSFTAGDTASGGALNNLDPGDVVTVCFKNEPLPTRTVRVHKVVQGSGAPAETFDYTIEPGGISGALSNTGTANHSVLQNTAYTVKETEALGTGWSFVKYTRKSSLDSNCEGSGWSDQGTVQANGVAIPSNTSDYTVCIYNQYTPEWTVNVCKLLTGNNDGQALTNQTFGFEVKYGDVTVPVSITVDEYLPNQDGALPADTTYPFDAGSPIKCESVSIPGQYSSATATEVTQPAGWVNGSFGPGQFYPAKYDGSWVWSSNASNTPPLSDSLSKTSNWVVFKNKGSIPPDTRDVTVCKVVISNGDSVVRGSFDWKFDVRQSGEANVVVTNGVAESAGVDGTESAEVCKTVKVRADKAFDVVEWGSRPGSPAWVDAAGYPKYAFNDGARVANNTTTSVAAGTTAVEVTFFNKEVPLSKEVIVEKYFLGLGTYQLQEGDWPTFTPVPAIPGFNFATDCVEYAGGNSAYWVCTVPADWNGTFTEDIDTEKWYQLSLADCRDYRANLQQNALVIEGSIAAFFCNQPYGTVIVNKINTSASGPNFEAVISGLPAQSVTGAALNGSPTIAQGSPSTQTNVPLSGTPLVVTEVNAGTVETCGSGATNYFTIVQAPADTVLDTPGEVQEWTIVNQPCGVLGQGGIVLQKFRDNNGDGVTNGSDGLIAWTFRITGPGGYDETFNLTAAQMPHLVGGLAPGNYTVSELTEAGWRVIGLRVDNGALVAAATQTTVAVDGGLNVLRGVTFYNQPRVNIEVSKTIFNNANPAGANGGSGWTFTLNGCGIGPDQKTTGAGGTVSWTDLPPAVGCSYTVTETAKAGWIADQISKSTSPSNPGQTASLGFINRQFEGCTSINNCDQPNDPTPTPVTPTNTPVTDETPTVDPTATNTPAEAVEGEKTPGPGDQATPIAPDTGAGFGGSTSAGMNVLLIIAGLIAISGGLSFMALGRQKR